MGATVSKTSVLTKAQILGNPEEPLYLAKGPRTNLYHGITLLQASCFGSQDGWEAGDTTFGYQLDFTRFETGYIIHIKYERNFPEESDMILTNPLDDPMENQVLDTELGNIPFSYFNHHILPKLNLTSYITSIQFYTDPKGNACIGRETQYSVEDIHYNTILENLTTPRVRVSELVVPETYRTHHPHIKIVQYLGNLYAYKFHGILPLSFESTTNNDDLLQEVVELSKFNSPFILSPSFIVTDRNNAGQFRGFLHPFMPAGSILDVFKTVHRIESEEDSKRHRFRFSTQDTKTTPYDPRVDFLDRQHKSLAKPLLSLGELAISWSVKLSWAIDIVSAIKVLHKAGSFCSDFTLENFLVTREGHVTMIDIAPVRGFTLYYAPPELKEDGDLTPSEPRDVYNFGVVLWMLSEEIIQLRLDSPEEIAGVTWRDAEGCAPVWYPSSALLLLEQHLEDAHVCVNIVNIMEQSNAESQRLGSQSTDAEDKARIKTLVVWRRSLGYPVSFEDMKEYAAANNLLSSAVPNVLTHMTSRMKNGPIFFDWFYGEPFVGVAADNSRRSISMATPERIEILKAILGKTDPPKWTIVGV
ncbi:hypothetical protein BDN70DRAFT_936619 [Pholiota conissans]|uniref:Protein kinase domain-containing protein n=1 Tax=Pholiota conissans TaxID=109636 RepID=A0A9P6CV62_9AGAR|nr:hypothetical protein BDN70DRAFT_936619 [Pholiota conissans]